MHSIKRVILFVIILCLNNTILDAMMAPPPAVQPFQPLAATTTAVMILAISDLNPELIEDTILALSLHLPAAQVAAIPHNTRAILYALHMPINPNIARMCIAAQAHLVDNTTNHYIQANNQYLQSSLAAFAVLAHANISGNSAAVAVQFARNIINGHAAGIVVPPLDLHITANILNEVNPIITIAQNANQMNLGGGVVAVAVVNNLDAAITIAANILAQSGVPVPNIPAPVAPPVALNIPQQVDKLIEKSYFSPEMQYNVIQCAPALANRTFHINVVTGKPANIPTIDQIRQFAQTAAGAGGTDITRKVAMNALFEAYEAVNLALFLAALDQAYEQPNYILGAPGLSTELTRGITSLTSQVINTQRVDILMPPVNQDIIDQLKTHQDNIKTRLNQLREVKSWTSWGASYLPTTLVTMFSGQPTATTSAPESQAFNASQNIQDPRNTVALSANLIGQIAKNYDYKIIKNHVDTANLLFKQCFLAQRTIVDPVNDWFIFCIPTGNAITPTNYIFDGGFHENGKDYTLSVDDLCSWIIDKVDNHGGSRDEAHQLFKQMRKAVQTAIYIANKNSNLYSGYVIPPTINRALDRVVKQLMIYDTKLSGYCKAEAYGGRYDDYYRDAAWTGITLIAAGVTTAAMIDTVFGSGTSSRAIQYGAQQAGYYSVEGLKKLAYYGLISPLQTLGQGISYTATATGGAISGAWNSALGRQTPAQLELQKQNEITAIQEQKIQKDPILQRFWAAHPGQQLKDLTKEDLAEYNRLHYLAETNTSNVQGTGQQIVSQFMLNSLNKNSEAAKLQQLTIMASPDVRKFTDAHPGKDYSQYSASEKRQFDLLYAKVHDDPTTWTKTTSNWIMPNTTSTVAHAPDPKIKLTQEPKSYPSIFYDTIKNSLFNNLNGNTTLQNLDKAIMTSPPMQQFIQTHGDPSQYSPEVQQQYDQLYSKAESHVEKSLILGTPEMQKIIKSHPGVDPAHYSAQDKQIFNEEYEKQYETIKGIVYPQSDLTKLANSITPILHPTTPSAHQLSESSTPIDQFWAAHPGQQFKDLTQEAQAEIVGLYNSAPSSQQTETSVQTGPMNRPLNRIQQMIANASPEEKQAVIQDPKMQALIRNNGGIPFNQFNPQQKEDFYKLYETIADANHPTCDATALLKQFAAAVGDMSYKALDRAAEIIGNTDFSELTADIAEHPATPYIAGAGALGATGLKINSAIKSFGASMSAVGDAAAAGLAQGMAAAVPGPKVAIPTPVPTTPNMLISTSAPGKAAQFVVNGSSTYTGNLPKRLLLPAPATTAAATSSTVAETVGTSFLGNAAGKIATNAGALGAGLAVGAGVAQAGMKIYNRATGTDTSELDVNAIEQATNQAMANNNSYN